ncbi:hypothetical protein ABIB00_007939, partial [Bradyrhizobium sp. LB14.3]|uniref:hypothetical protein n=1 Tax=Bradyrhizobium sp. LB14.3 TaxID=3156328 RepID=UPI003399C454
MSEQVIALYGIETSLLSSGVRVLALMRGQMAGALVKTRRAAQSHLQDDRPRTRHGKIAMNQSIWFQPP